MVIFYQGTVGHNVRVGSGATFSADTPDVVVPLVATINWTSREVPFVPTTDLEAVRYGLSRRAHDRKVPADDLIESDPAGNSVNQFAIAFHGYGPACDLAPLRMTKVDRNEVRDFAPHDHIYGIPRIFGAHIGT